MLNDRRNGLDRQRVYARARDGHVLLIADADVALTDGDQRRRGPLGGLDDRDIQAGIPIIALV